MALYNTAIGKMNSFSIGRNDIGETVIGPGGNYGAYATPVNLRQLGGAGSPVYGMTDASKNLVDGIYGTGVSSILGGPSTSTAKADGTAAMQSAVDTAKTGVATAKDASSSVSARLGLADVDLSEAKAAARGIGQDISSVRQTASGLSPYASVLSGMGSELNSRADDLYGIGSAIRSGDSSMGGILGAYISSVLGMNPESRVSRAAQDVQSSADNAMGQLERSLSRSGVSPTSGAYQQLKANLMRTVAGSIASAKTRAWSDGRQEQLAALQSALQTSLAADQQAQSAKQAAMQGMESAAGIVQKQGDLYSTAGSMGATQANAFTNIGGVEVNMGNLDISAAKNVQDAIQNVTAAQEALANFYAGMADTDSLQYNSNGGWTRTVTSKS